MNNSSNYSNGFEWLISSLGEVVFTALSSGSVKTFYVKKGASVRPTFYLTSTTSIISGTGTMDDPYIIDN